MSRSIDPSMQWRERSMKRTISDSLVAEVPLVVAIAQVRADPWSMFETSATAGGLPPAIDVGPLQLLDHGVRCHLRWTPEAGQLRQRWIRSTMSLTGDGDRTSINMITRYLSEATIGGTYGSGVLIHRALGNATRQLTASVRERLEVAWSANAQSSGDELGR